MPTTRLSTKGQLIIPKLIRERQGWTAGTLLEISEEPNGVLVRGTAAAPGSTSLADLVGCAGYRGPRRSLADMEAGVEAAAKRKM